MNNGKLMFFLIALASFSIVFFTSTLNKKSAKKNIQPSIMIERSVTRNVSESQISHESSESRQTHVEAIRKRSEPLNELGAEYFTVQSEQNTRTATKNILAKTIAVMKAREANDEN